MLNYDLEDILYKHYNLQDFTIQKFEKQGFVHQVFKVKAHNGSLLANKGSGDTRTNTTSSITFLLKVYNTAINDIKRLRRSIYTSLLFKKFITNLAVAPIQNAKGEYLTITPGCVCALFPYIEHIPLKRYDVPMLAHLNVAAFLGEIHNKYIEHKRAIDLTVKRLQIASPYDMLAKLNKNLDKLKQAKVELLTKLGSIDKKAAKLLERAILFAKKLIQDYEDLIMLSAPVYLAHRDITVNNLLFDKNYNIVALIDFDRAAYINLFREVWYYLFTNIIGPNKLYPKSEYAFKFLQTYKKNFKHKINKDYFEQAKIIELVYWSTKTWPFEKFIENPKQERWMLESQQFLIDRAEDIIKLYN